MNLVELIEEARRRLKGVVHESPLVYSTSFSRMFGVEVYLKLENLQKTGSFKVRGAYNRISLLTEEEKARGVVAASSGNHAQGVAWAAGLLGVRATIVMPETTPIVKYMATKGYGAEVILHGRTFTDACQKAKELVRTRGLTFIHPFDDELIIAGQGTIGVEILSALPDADCVVVPVGGGGLISGIATWIKTHKKDVKIVGVESVLSPSLTEALKHHRPVAVTTHPSIADGINIKKVGERTLPLIERYVDCATTVQEETIAEAIVKLMERKKLVVEGAGATGIAALMEQKIPLDGVRKLVVLLSGGNIDVTTLDRILRKGLVKEGRVCSIATIIDDVPGSLAGLTSVVAELRANILHILHHRDAVDVPVGRTKVELILEVSDRDHAERIKKRLLELGYGLTQD
ncbi:MAG TPA: threonine ammonia-lyase [Deltaproteobacteria bacterium]|nr:threonine ammonia-lyase [Deltaproteobacteria bacterium]